MNQTSESVNYVNLLNYCVTFTIKCRPIFVPRIISINYKDKDLDLSAYTKSSMFTFFDLPQ